MQKVLAVVGTRPEAIKLAPVIRELQGRPDCHAVVCATAQHRDMLDQVLDLFDIKPDFDLDLMRANQSPSLVASRILANFDEVLEEVEPDWVLVQGDTTTVLAASIAAFHRKVKVGHVEAGLRTHDKWQPFPEEVNRRVASVIADLHFAPTERARANLLNESVPSKSIHVTGNTVIDALKWVVSQPVPVNTRRELTERGLQPPEELNGKRSRLVLVTAHRRENHGPALGRICEALKELAVKYGDEIAFVFPVHPHPNVRTRVQHELSAISNIILVPPLDYVSLVYVLRLAYLVVTDSGGLQEEAPGLGKPVLVLRDCTERPEGIDAGTAKLIGTHQADIVREVSRLLDDEISYRSMANSINPYGDGHASSRIVDAVLQHDGTYVSQARAWMRIGIE